MLVLVLALALALALEKALAHVHAHELAQAQAQAQAMATASCVEASRALWTPPTQTFDGCKLGTQSSFISTNYLGYGEQMTK